MTCLEPEKMMNMENTNAWRGIQKKAGGKKSPFLRSGFLKLIDLLRGKSVFWIISGRRYEYGGGLFPLTSGCFFYGCQVFGWNCQRG